VAPTHTRPMVAISVYGAGIMRDPTILCTAAHSTSGIERQEAPSFIPFQGFLCRANRSYSFFFFFFFSLLSPLQIRPSLSTPPNSQVRSEVALSTARYATWEGNESWRSASHSPYRESSSSSSLYRQARTATSPLDFDAPIAHLFRTREPADRGTTRWIPLTRYS
jgi:hypothetical protein